jgi:MFS family permease
VTAIEGTERAELQRRTIRTLMVGVVPAGAAMVAGFSAAALLGKEITGSAAWGTLAAACLTVGSTIATVPLARYMSHHGRRRGLRRGWTLAACGMTLAFTAAVADLYPFLLLGMLLLGVGNASNLSTRYAAADLAADGQRAKAIGLLVWAASFGSVLGPILGLGVVGNVVEWFGLPQLAGPYLMGAVLLILAAVFIDRRLRPDPLVVAGGVSPEPDGPATSGGLAAVGRPFQGASKPLAQVFRHPSARLAVVAMLVGHAVMVGIMTATPLHMEDGDHGFQIIGFVISVHIIGMYFLAPIIGWLSDRLGPRPLIAAGGIVLFVGAELASHTSAEDSLGVFVGLFLVGLGWSLGLIAGSSLLTASFPVDQRVNVQGASDLIMSASGALAALAAGIVYEFGGYHDLSHWAGLGALGLSAYAVWRFLRVRVWGGPAVVSGS